VWDMDRLAAFVHEVESVDPSVTGHPVQTYYASRHMQQSYIHTGLYALGAVLVLLWIDFRSLTHSLLAMTPLLLGFVQMCGLFGWFNIPLNPANMIVLPVILGIGVDHGVHLVHLWRQQRGRFVLNDSTAVAMLLTATTTTASFGVLILARHQGLQSLGQVLTLGVTTCLFSSILFFPALLRWMTRNRPEEVVSDEPIPEAVAALDTPTAGEMVAGLVAPTVAAMVEAAVEPLEQESEVEAEDEAESEPLAEPIPAIPRRRALPAIADVGDQAATSGRGASPLRHLASLRESDR
jgi:uncharacterized protein